MQMQLRLSASPVVLELRVTVRVARSLLGREPQDLPVNLQGRLLGESAEHTHEGDLVREAQPIVGAPPQGDLSSVGLEEGGIADQAGAGNVGVGDRHDSVSAF